MKCPKMYIEYPFDSDHEYPANEFDDCIEEKCAIWLKTPGACAKKVEAQQSQIANIHLQQIVEALRSISQGVYR